MIKSVVRQLFAQSFAQLFAKGVRLSTVRLSKILDLEKGLGVGQVMGILALTATASPSLAQSPDLPACQPPAAGEYLLLVVTPTAQTQAQLKQSLPPSVNVPACNYLGSQVSRMGGFRDLENANAWSQYITEVVGLPAFVARPSAETAETASVAVTSPTPRPSFDPQTLGAGYAVLVDYFNDPAMATQIQRLRQEPPGLVSYGQRPYLLVDHTRDSNGAVATLQSLTNQGYQVLLVDSREVILLIDQVAQP
jgi:hypothetical protein